MNVGCPSKVNIAKKFLRPLHLHLFYLGENLDVIQTEYKPKADNENCQNGLTFKKHMIENFIMFQEMTICFRFHIDFFMKNGKYDLVSILIAGNDTGVTDVRTLHFSIT